MRNKLLLMVAVAGLVVRVRPVRVARALLRYQHQGSGRE